MALDDEFDQFWRAFPRKTGKLAAQKAYRKARTMASAQEILDGVEAYRRAKPVYADWCHPQTFLNQGRWLDEPDTPRPSYEWHCTHEPRCGNRATCQIVSMRKTG